MSHMIRFAEHFPDMKIVSSLMRQLSWPHFTKIHVASYWTKLLPRKQLERKLHGAVRLARARLAAGMD